MNIAMLQRKVTGRIVRPEDPGYDEARSGWNLLVDSRPAIIVEATCAEDVAAAVRFANEADLPVGVKATGHGASVSDHGALMISTRSLQGIAINPATETARIDPGVVAQDVLDAAATHGLTSLTGTGMTVSVAGFVSGGGMPVLGRTFGFAADHVQSLDLVLADGSHVHATAEQHPDLFWAARGGKGNFGILTSVEIGLVPQTSFYGGVMTFPITALRSLLEVWLPWTAELSNAMNTSVTVNRYPDISTLPESLRANTLANLRVAYVGDDVSGSALIETFRALGPIADSTRVWPASEIRHVPQTPPAPAPSRDRAMLLTHLDTSAIDAFVDVVGDSVSLPPGVVELRVLGGKMAEQPQVQSPTGHRTAPFVISTVFAATAETIDVVDAIAGNIYAAMDRWHEGKTIANYLGVTDTTVESVRTAYTDADYARLRSIKAGVDPDYRFRLAHPIPPLT